MDHDSPTSGLLPGLTRRQLTLGAGAAAIAPVALSFSGALRAQGNGRRVLRYAFPVAESNFDPAQTTDLYSRTLTSGIFDAPLEFEFLAEPARMRPATAAAMPEVSDNYTRFVFRIRPGILFSDDPAFQGRKRELTAEDYVYSIKRHYDPRWKSGNLYLLENAKILGLSEFAKRLADQGRPFDYDTPVEGLRTLDRYTFQIRVGEPNPRLLYLFTDGSFLGAMAREVCEFYGDRIGEHPVGTGPFRLASWTRSSRIVLARNPNYREVRYDETPPDSKPGLVRTAAEFKGRLLPLVDEVHIAVVQEAQPRWLSFLNEQHDMIEGVPAEFANIAFPNNVLAPNLQRRDIRMVRTPRVDVALSYFGMEHPVVGGYEPHKVALRRAISLAVDIDQELALLRRRQAIPAQGPIAPGTFGYDPTFRSTMSEFNRARAKALLDMHGYVDRNGDGWRQQPDGSPLVLEYATQSDQISRQAAELWQKNMNAIGIRIVFNIATWPEQLRASRAGRLMMWGVGWSGGSPDGETFIGLGYGPNKGGANHARFDLPAFNRVFEQQRVLPDGPERLELMQQAARLMIAYMPYKVHVHRISTSLAHPWVQGFQINNFVREFWKYVDVDLGEQRRRGAATL
jgi:ABC-type transport system substrate-binding protein